LIHFYKRLEREKKWKEQVEQEQHVASSLSSSIEASQHQGHGQ